MRRPSGVVQRLKIRSTHKCTQIMMDYLSYKVINSLPWTQDLGAYIQRFVKMMAECSATAREVPSLALPRDSTLPARVALIK